MVTKGKPSSPFCGSNPGRPDCSHNADVDRTIPTVLPFFYAEGTLISCEIFGSVARVTRKWKVSLLQVRLHISSSEQHRQILIPAQTFILFMNATVASEVLTKHKTLH
jgi:hypothetical protein